MYNEKSGDMERKNARTESLVCHLAAEFLQQNSNKSSLITVTGCTLGKEGKEAIIFISVLPEDKAVEALNFALRQRSEMRAYIRTHAKLGRLPFLDIALAPAA